MILVLALGALTTTTTACRQDMHDQAKVKPLARSDFFEDELSARPLVDGTVPHGYLNADSAYYTGKTGKDYVAKAPVQVTEQLLHRGQERFNIFCSPCHDRTGNGRGMVVQRGYKPPPTYHQDRLRKVEDGYIFDVITNGFGAMPSYAPQVPAADRWAIVEWVRVLQLSQNVPEAGLPEQARKELEQGQGKSK